MRFQSDATWDIDKLLGEEALALLAKAKVKLQWVQSPYVPHAPLSNRQAIKICRAFLGPHARLPGTAREVLLNPGALAKLWLTNQAGDLSWNIGKSGFGSTQFVLKLIPR